jgi:hypothetical protein
VRTQVNTPAGDAQCVLTLTITVQFRGGPETQVFRSDIVPPEAIGSTLEIACNSVRGALIAARANTATIRQYLGPALLSTGVWQEVP